MARMSRSKVWQPIATTAISIVLQLFVLSSAQAVTIENGKIGYNAGDIFVINADGSGNTNLTNNPVFHFFTAPAWSPDGEKIAYSAYEGSSWDIWTIKADGTQKTDITNSEGYSPAWSPDGSKIAYTNGDIYVINADGTGKLNLTNSPAYDSYPAWSPTGEKIAYGNVDIYTINPDGTGNRMVADSGGNDSDPSWSPNGEKIVYSNDDIYTVNADGTGNTKIVDTNWVSDYSPSWSPNGEKILFANGEVYTINPDGSGTTNISNSSNHDSSPTWSPDGNKVAYASFDGQWDVYTVNFDGTDRSDLTPLAGDQTEPTWQPVIIPDPTPEPVPVPEEDSTTPPSEPDITQPVYTLPSLNLSTPSFGTANRTKIKRSTLFRRYLRTGFKGTQTGYKRVEAYLLRVKYFNIRSSGNGQGAASQKKRCYKLHRRQSVSCNTTTTNGVSMGSSGKFTVKPLGIGRRSREIRSSLNGGARLSEGNYDLTIKAYPASSETAKTFTYRFYVNG